MRKRLTRFLSPLLPVLFHLVIFILMEFGGRWGCFKRCIDCRGKITSTDRQLRCLLCLGEGHKVASCEICKEIFPSDAKKTNKTSRTSPTGFVGKSVATHGIGCLVGTAGLFGIGIAYYINSFFNFGSACICFNSIYTLIDAPVCKIHSEGYWWGI